MSRITGLEPDPRRPGSVRVMVDGALLCTVARDAAAGLAVGAAVDEALAERLARAADVEAALRTIMRSLELRSYARADLGRRLVRKGHPREAVAAALDHVAALGLLDDAAYARNYAETRAARGRGPARLVADLLRMGVARDAIDAAVAAAFPEDGDRTAMPLELAKKRARQLGALPRPDKRRRLLAYLARRGFTGREAFDAVTRATGGDADIP